jgi:hypothetical protein
MVKSSTRTVEEAEGYREVTIYHYECVRECSSSQTEVFNRCITKSSSEEDTDEDEFETISKDLLKGLPYIGIIGGVALVFSYVELILIRHAIKYIIWIIWISFVLLMVVGALAMFVILNNPIAGAILLVFAIVCVVLLYYFRHRIRMVAKVFKEASIALIDIPGLMFEPILVSNYGTTFH